MEDKIEVVGRRVAESELEQAWLNGVNSILANQTHTHETLDAGYFQRNRTAVG